MKKNYFAPATKVIVMKPYIMQANSSSDVIKAIGVINPIKYGGIDEEGELDPASRRSKDWWDDDEEDW